MSTTRKLKNTITALAFTFAMAGVAHALPTAMKITGKANPPIGAYEFCRNTPSACAGTHPDTGPLQLDEAHWKTLLKINYQVNAAIQPMTDEEMYGVEEKWSYPTSAGDCEDFALLKQKLLEQAGFSPSDLLVTVVLQPNGEGHAVLTVRTDRGDFILDNMRNRVMLWSETEYRYLKRQAATSAAAWDKIQDGRAAVVGSVSP